MSHVSWLAGRDASLQLSLGRFFGILRFVLNYEAANSPCSFSSSACLSLLPATLLRHNELREEGKMLHRDVKWQNIKLKFARQKGEPLTTCFLGVCFFFFTCVIVTTCKVKDPSLSGSGELGVSRGASRTFGKPLDTVCSSSFISLKVRIFCLCPELSRLCPSLLLQLAHIFFLECSYKTNPFSPKCPHVMSLASRKSGFGPSPHLCLTDCLFSLHSNGK